jgi:transposase
METFVGLDVSLRETSICVLNHSGEILWRGKTASDPEAIAATVRAKAPNLSRVGFETGPLSTWHWHALRDRGLPAVCLDARQTKPALALQLNKTDGNDAHGLAQIVRTGWYREVEVKSLDAHTLRATLAVRARLVALQTTLANQIRGILKTFGVIVSNARGQRFDWRVAAATEGRPDLAALYGPLLEVWLAARTAMCRIDKQIRATARRNATCRLLMTVPGVGVVTALSYMAVIDDPQRFKSSASVGAYLGLTPRRYQSGEIDYTGRISKRGDRMLRSYLYEAATVLLTRCPKWSPLKACGVRLQKRLGFKKAAVAVARKLAVILHAVWKTGTEFRWTAKEAAA